jgi:hypothetical protein
MLGVASPETHAEFLKKIPFIVSWETLVSLAKESGRFEPGRLLLLDCEVILDVDAANHALGCGTFR